MASRGTHGMGIRGASRKISVSQKQYSLVDGTSDSVLEMIRERILYKQAYSLMQKGTSPEAVLEGVEDSSEEKYENVRGHLQDKVQCLAKLLSLWSELTDDKKDDKNIHSAITLSGNKPKDFLDSLSIKITNPYWMKGRWWQWKRWERVSVIHGGLLHGLHEQEQVRKFLPINGDLLSAENMHVLNLVHTGTETPGALKELLPTSEEQGGKPSFFSTIFSPFINTSRKIEYEAHWCGVQGLFELDGQDPTRYMMILGQMCRAPANAFQTIVGQALVRHHWNITFYEGFLLDRLIDIIQLINLYTIASNIHFQCLPPILPVYGALGCSMLNVVANIAGHLQCIVMYKTLRPVATFWNWIFALMDGFTMIVIMLVVQQSYNPFYPLRLSDAELHSDFEGSFFAKHPPTIAFLVAGKWFYFMLSLLNLEFIGTAILPAWEAGRSRESLVFLVYLGVGTVACAHSYYTFAIDDVPDFAYAFFRMVRLTFLGDFDMMEIMGVDQHLALSNVSALYEAASLDWQNITETIVGGIDDDEQPFYKYGIRTWVLMWAFIMPVIFMNIYIGLLSAAYDKACDDVGALFSQFRISNLMMSLLRKHFLKHPLRSLGKLCSMICNWKTQEAQNYVQMREEMLKDHPDQAEFDGYWIIVPKGLLDEVDDADDISDKLDDVSATMEAQVMKLKDEMGDIKQMLIEMTRRTESPAI